MGWRVDRRSRLTADCPPGFHKVCLSLTREGVPRKLRETTKGDESCRPNPFSNKLMARTSSETAPGLAPGGFPSPGRVESVPGMLNERSGEEMEPLRGCELETNFVALSQFRH